MHLFLSLVRTYLTQKEKAFFLTMNKMQYNNENTRNDRLINNKNTTTQPIIDKHLDAILICFLISPLSKKRINPPPPSSNKNLSNRNRTNFFKINGKRII